MNIRYRIKYSGGVATSVYSIEDLENKALIDSLYFLQNDSVEIIGRDIGTMKLDINGDEIFENDRVQLKHNGVGIVKLKPGGFYVNNIPLGEVKTARIIKEV